MTFVDNNNNNNKNKISISAARESRLISFRHLVIKFPPSKGKIHIFFLQRNTLFEIKCLAYYLT